MINDYYRGKLPWFVAPPMQESENQSHNASDGIDMNDDTPLHMKEKDEEIQLDKDEELVEDDDINEDEMEEKVPAIDSDEEEEKEK